MRISGLPLRRVCASVTLPVVLLVPGSCMNESQAVADPPAAVATAAKPVALKAEAFPLSSVRVTGGPFLSAIRTDKSYLLALDADRLLSHVRENAGLPAKAPHYGGWENGGAGIIGHYLSAISLMYAATGDPAVKKRVDYVVAELAACQKAGDGGIYSFGYDKNEWFAKLKQGEVLQNNVNGWYVLHKTMAGLRDAYVETGSEEAKRSLIRLCDWCDTVTAKLTPEQWQVMLNAEHGAPQEILADVYAWTGDEKYLRLAEKFRHDKVFTPLASDSDTVLNGLHANTQIPKFVGYERIYELTGEKTWNDAATHFWEHVTADRTWANGGNSQWEGFFPPAQSGAKLLEVCGPETCNTYNMLKLSHQIFAVAPSAKYMEYYENALYNSILPSQGPQGGFVYYTPMRPGHYRVFSNDHDAFWCCVGTGMENPGRYGEMVYAHSTDSADGAKTLYVNLFLPSTLGWKEQGLTLTQTTTFPDTATSELALKLAAPKTLTLAIRKPTWADGFAVTVNGKAITTRANAEGYVPITREWKSGDQIALRLPMTLKAEPLPQDSQYVAFRYGPVLLAGKLGTSGLTKSDFYRTDQLARQQQQSFIAPAIIGTSGTALSHLSPAPGKPLQFALAGTTQSSPVTLVPFFRLFEERYAIYFPTVDAAQAKERERLAAEAVQDRTTLAARTVDRVRIGTEESEKAHGFASEKSSSGTAPASTEGDKWRDTSGYMRYTLTVKPDATNALRCAYWGSDKDRRFTVLVDGVSVGTESLTGDQPGDYVIRTYAIPAEQTRGKSTVTVEFRPATGSVAGGVMDVRTVQPLPPTR